MKTQYVKNFVLVLLLASVISLVFATTAYAASKNYYGLTTVYYNNYVTDQGGWNWNGNYNDYTSPSRSMDQFGLTFWSTYCSCNNSIQWESYGSYDSSDPWMMRYNKTTIADGMAKRKVQCLPSQTLRGHNNIQHWWQDSGNPGDGGTINYKKVLANP